MRHVGIYSQFVYLFLLGLHLLFIQFISNGLPHLLERVYASPYSVQLFVLSGYLHLLLVSLLLNELLVRSDKLFFQASESSARLLFSGTA